MGGAGAGKTSVINTIFRLMELDQGGIFIDGVEIAKLGLAQLRNAMAIIPQVTPLLHAQFIMNVVVASLWQLHCGSRGVLRKSASSSSSSSSFPPSSSLNPDVKIDMLVTTSICHGGCQDNPHLVAWHCHIIAGFGILDQNPMKSAASSNGDQPSLSAYPFVCASVLRHMV